MTTKKPGGLGRGLGALIPSGPVAKSVGDKPVETRIVERIVEKEVETGRPLRLSVTLLRVNSQQPRTVFNGDDMEDLVNSVREHGILQPIVVTPGGDGTFEIVAGERRFRAAKAAGLTEVPAIVRETEDSRDKLVLALIENIQRSNLNPLEEARAYDRLSREFGYTQEVIAKSVGKARSTVANLMRLLDLPVEIQEAIATGIVPAGSARAILALPDVDSQLAFFRKILKKQMSTREVERGVRKEGGATRKDAGTAAAEEELRQALGTRVEVKPARGGKREGHIVISFYSEEEFESLFRKLVGRA